MGHMLFVVGGSVRDELLGRVVNDTDLTTDALPDDIERILSASGLGTVYPLGKKFGTIGLVLHNGEKIEITTFKDESTKENIKFGTTLTNDLNHRDFTINAIAKNVLTGQIIDPTGGQKDIKTKTLRAVGSARDRFREDPARMLRAIRLFVSLDFENFNVEMPEPELLDKVSRERISEEFNKMLLTKNPVKCVDLLKEFKLMEHIVPEFTKLYDLKQNKWHKYDAYTHTLDTLNKTSKLNYNGKDQLIVNLLALLHDIGKPKTKTDHNGDIHFYDHEHESATIAKETLTDLKYDFDTIERVVKLIDNHMRPMQAFKVEDDVKHKFIRRLIRTLGRSDTKILLDFYEIDASSSNFPSTAIIEKVKTIFNEVLEEPDKPEGITSPLDGDDIMRIFNLKPSREVRQIKEYLIDQVIEGNLTIGDKQKAEELTRERFGDILNG
jgi:putative nucleotidyltransferase with HDIG domain